MGVWRVSTPCLLVRRFDRCLPESERVSGAGKFFPAPYLRLTAFKRNQAFPHKIRPPTGYQACLGSMPGLGSVPLPTRHATENTILQPALWWRGRTVFLSQYASFKEYALGFADFVSARLKC
eukprot:1155435-Pelagomonas_calceolata.AAC.2